MLSVRFSSFLRTKSYSISRPLSFPLSLYILFVHLVKGCGLHQSFGYHDWCCTIMCEQISLQMLALNYLRYIPRMKFLYHTIILLLMSWGPSILFSPAALPLCFPTRSTEGLFFPRVHTSMLDFLLFIISSSHLNRSDACSGLVHIAKVVFAEWLPCLLLIWGSLHIVSTSLHGFFELGTVLLCFMHQEWSSL